jgi:hypothetical protein
VSGSGEGVEGARSAAVTCTPSAPRCRASGIPPAHLTGAAKLAVQYRVVLLGQRSTTQDCHEAGKRPSPGPADLPDRDNAGRDGIAGAR